MIMKKTVERKKVEKKVSSCLRVALTVKGNCLGVLVVLWDGGNEIAHSRNHADAGR
jgi:hypothetical protein